MINSEIEHNEAMDRLSILLDIDPLKGTDENNELERLCVAVRIYDDKYWPCGKKLELSGLLISSSVGSYDSH
jgi:hypothetical protein